MLLPNFFYLLTQIRFRTTLHSMISYHGGIIMDKIMISELKHFNYLTNEIDAAYHEAALKLHLSDSALMILYTICNHGDSCPLHDIRKLSGISKQTINSALRKLEADGVVYLEQFEGKKKKVCLTAKGRELAENTAVPLIEIENDIFASWTKAEKSLYLELTHRYLTAFREKIEKLAP